MTALQTIKDGLIKRNPTFVLILGMCPTLGTTSSALTGMSMGLATLAVLICSNMAIYSALGIFIPLIVVNCILLGRAEAFASKNSVLLSACDGLGIGAGFTLALTAIGAVRELLGTGAVFGFQIYDSSFGALLFVLAPGAFIVLGFLIALFNYIRHA